MPHGRSVTTRDSLSMRILTLALGSLVLFLINGSLGQDIVFPGQRPSPIPHVAVLSTTSPSTVPVPEIKCPENMTLTKEPGETESYCECIIGNLYYEKLDRCFLQYTKGPCKEREHFILRPNKTVAECVRNPCQVKDTVLYKGSCYELYVSGGPCDPDKTLTIPETSHEPKCVVVSTAPYQVITAPLRPCEPGSRRTNRGVCRKKIR